MERVLLAAWRASPLSTLLVAAAFGAAAAAPVETVEPVVQVAVNYAPGKSTMISGLLVGGGRFVLTQANILHGAYDTVVAFTNTDVLDPVLERFDEQLNVAVLRLPRPVRAEFAAVAELPVGELPATIVGAPTAFRTGKLSVLLKPVTAGRRWEIVPAVPLAFRGAPILDSEGRLLGIAVEGPESTTVVGIPITELGDLVPGLAVQRLSASPAAPAPKPAQVSQPEVAPPASGSKTVAPPGSKPEGESEPPREAPEPVGQPLTQLPVPNSAAGVEVRPPPKPAPAVTGELVVEEEEAAAEEKSAPQPAAEPKPAPTVRSSEKQAAATNPGAADPGVWEARIRQDPDDPQLRFRHAEAQLSAGDYRKAVEVLEEAQQRFPLVPRVYWYLAHGYWHQSLHKPDGGRRRSMENKTYRKSLAAFETFLALAPNDPRAPEARSRLNLLKQAQYGRQ